MLPSIHRSQPNIFPPSSSSSNAVNAQTAQAPCLRSQQKQQEINRKEINHQKEEQQQKRATNKIRTNDFDADDEADFLSFPKYYESHPADKYPTEELSDIEQISAQERNIQLKEKFVPIPVGIYFKKSLLFKLHKCPFFRHSSIELSVSCKRLEALHLFQKFNRPIRRHTRNR